MANGKMRLIVLNVNKDTCRNHDNKPNLRSSDKRRQDSNLLRVRTKRYGMQLIIKKLLILIVLLSQGCKTDISGEVMAPELSMIFNNFVNEGARRGIKLNPNEDLRIRFGKIEGKKSASCKPNSHPKIITIDSMAWKYINPAQKEKLLFHELAHCLLKRPHFNESFEQGECKSWMREDESKCNINFHNAEWRQYYLDELFNPTKVSIPYWFNTTPKFYDTRNLTISQSIKFDQYEFQYFDSLFINSPKDWIIDFKSMKSQTGPNSIGITLNEVAIETTFITSGNKFKPHMIVLQSNPKKIILETATETNVMELSLHKQSDILFIYFGATLCYRIPIRETILKIGAYCSFPEGHYSLNFYAL